MASLANILIRHKDRFSTFGLVLISVAYVVFGAWSTSPRFGANDNLAILDFLIHGHTVPYCGVLFTGLLHFAYQVLPSVPWYALSLYSLHALSVFLWLVLLRRVFKPWWATIGVMLVFLTYYIQFLALLDYTSTSVMLCMSSLCFAMVEVVQNRAAGWRFALLGVVFTLGVMVRTDGGLGAVAFALPMVVFVVLLRLRERVSQNHTGDGGAQAHPMGVFTALLRFRIAPFKTEALHLAFIALVFFAPVMADMAVDAGYRQLTLTPQEAQYEEFNYFRSQIHRVTNQERYALMRDQPLLKAISWNQKEMGYFLNWYFLDERVYNTEAVRMIAENLPAQPFTLSELGNAFLQRISQQKPVFLLLIFSLPLLLLGSLQKPWPNIIGLSWPVYCLGLIAFMGTRFTFLERVSVPFETAFGFSSLILAAMMIDMQQRFDGRIRMGALLITLGIMLACAAPLAQKSANYAQQNTVFRARLNAKLQQLNDGFSGRVVLVQAGPGLLMESSDPLDITWPSFHPIDLGWSIYSPRYYEQIGALGIQHSYQLVDALIARPDAYLLGTKGWCENLLYFATDSAKRDIQVVAIKTFDDGTGLYRYQETKR